MKRLKKKLFMAVSCILGILMCSSCTIPGFTSQSGEENMEITLELPRKAAVPYIQPALEYLEAGAGANVRQYMVSVDNPNQAIKLSCDCEGEGVVT